MVGNEPNICHTVDEEMENVSTSGNDCRILNVSSETPSCAEKNGTDTNAELASNEETKHSSDKNVVSLGVANHEMDIFMEKGNESLVGNLDCIKNYVLGLGKEFETEDQAYNSYLEYATLEGFSIRKDFVNKDYDGVVKSRRYTCSKEGYRRPKRGSKRGSNPKNPREDTRSGCLAHMTISLRPNGKYRVIHFETTHNHELGCLHVPSQRRINLDDVDNNIDSVEDEAPKLGMKFDSEDHAYEYYSTYALLAGFNIRKDYVNRSKKSGEVTSRRFTCCRGGSNNKEKNESSGKRPRKETRIGCLAHLIIVRHSDRKYHVTHYEGKHNHELVPACRIGMFRTQKMLALFRSVEEPAIASSDTPIVDVERVYNPVDSGSTLQGKRKRDMKEGESEAIFQYFQNRKKKDPSLVYAVQLDADGQMANIFWADAKMVEDYHFFGDVLCFDATYKLDNDCRPFVSFTGVNHHKKTLIFGAALLYDDTFESLYWLFQTYFKVMSLKKPKTILTDQDNVVAEAINSLLPNAHHRLCAWHMYQKALRSIDQETIGLVFCPDDLKSCFFNFDEEEDFVKAWETMIQNSNLGQNEVLIDIFREREKWAMPYGRHMLCADIRCAQLSDNLLPKVRKYIKSGLDIILCLNQFTKLLKDWRYNEIQANYDMSNQLPRLMGDIIMLKRARDIYTPKIFEIFQQEFETCLDFVVNQCNDDVAMVEFKVGTYGQERDYIVTFNSSEDSVSCSCMKFEFEGILCSHAIKVLDYRNIKVVPTQYLLKRWTKAARI